MSDSVQAWSEPTSARYYNDQPPEMIFYQGLALDACHSGASAHRHFKFTSTQRTQA